MAQYRSHTPETLEYMETYLLTFHRTKDIFLEFRTSKAIRAQAERQNRELRERIANADRTAGAAGSAHGGWTKLGLKGPLSGQN